MTTSHGSFRCQAQVSHAQLCGRRAQNWCENFEQSALAWISCNTAKGNQHIYTYVYIHLIVIVIIKFSRFLHVVPLKVMILCCQIGFTRAYVNVLLTKWAWLQSGRYIVLVFRLNRSTSTSTLVCKKAAAVGPRKSGRGDKAGNGSVATMFGRQGAAKPTILAIDPCPVLFMIDDFSSVRSPRLSDLRGDQPPCPRIEGNIYLQEPLIYVYIYYYYYLFIIYYLLFIIYYLLFVIYYLLFVICYLLFIIYYLLLLYNHHLNQFGSPN